jgi:hypothetical protein
LAAISGAQASRTAAIFRRRRKKVRRGEPPVEINLPLAFDSAIEPRIVHFVAMAFRSR